MSCKQEDSIKQGETYNFLKHHSRNDFKIRNKESKSALMLACANVSDEIALLLLQNSELTPEEIDLNGTDVEGWTPLHYAAKMGYLKVIELLCKKEAIIDATTNDGETCLHLASEYGHSKVVDFLADTYFGLIENITKIKTKK